MQHISCPFQWLLLLLVVLKGPVQWTAKRLVLTFWEKVGPGLSSICPQKAQELGPNRAVSMWYEYKLQSFNLYAKMKLKMPIFESFLISFSSSFLKNGIENEIKNELKISTVNNPNDSDMFISTP